MSGHEQGLVGVMGQCRCVECKGPLTLTSALQLPQCLHIFCSKCALKLKRNSGVNTLTCSKCLTESVDELTLTRIAGIGQDASNGQYVCDVCTKNSAIWNCFNCSQNLCPHCRIHHEEGDGDVGIRSGKHSLILLHQAANLSRQIFNTRRGSTYSDPGGLETECDEVDSSASSGEPRFVSTQLRSGLRDIHDYPSGACNQVGHTDNTSGQPLQLKFFCLPCWKPVCGDCSMKGEHKLHETKDLANMSDFLESSMAKTLQRMSALDLNCKKNLMEEGIVEERLRGHVDEISRSMEDRSKRIIEQTSEAFEKAKVDAEIKGRDILDTYKQDLSKIEQLGEFLSSIKNALNDITFDKNEFNVEKFVHVFHTQEKAKSLMDKLDKTFMELPKPQERRLVMPEIGPVVAPPPLPLARVGTEWSCLRLAFSIPLCDDTTFPRSLVVTGPEECLLSCEMSRSRDSDAVIHYSRNKDPVVHDVEQGRYYIARLQSGEIVASYSSRRTGNHEVQYNSGEVFSEGYDRGQVKFETVKPFDFAPKGITTTCDNCVLVCSFHAVEKHVEGKPGNEPIKHLSSLLKMSLQGKHLAETVRVPGPNMISPDFVCVSSEGGICVSDTEGSALVLLDKDLNITDRINYSLPSRIPSLINEDTCKFQPHGVCYDSYGRVIAADPNNHSIVRLVRHPKSLSYILQPLLTKSDDDKTLSRLNYPRLVAMGPDGRLWVVCSGEILVFDYCL